MALSSIAERQLQSQSQGGPAQMPGMFSFEQTKPKENKVLSRDEVKKAIENIPDKKAAIKQLIDNGFTLEGFDVQQPIQQAQPSIEGFLPTIEEAGRKTGEFSKDFIGALMTAPYKAVGGVGSVLGDLVSAGAYSDVSLKGIFTGENANKGIGGFFRQTTEGLEKGVTGAYGVDTGSAGYKTGEVVGGIATAVPTTLATGGLGLASKFQQAGTLGKVGYGALGGLGETALGYTTTEGRLGTPTELGIGAGLGVAGAGASMAYGRYGNNLSSFFSKGAGQADNIAGQADTAMNKADEVLAKRAKEFKDTIPGRINGLNVEIPKTSAIDSAKQIILPSVDPIKKANKALMPSYAGKTNKAIVEGAENAEKNANNLWKMVRTGVIDGDLSTLETSARTVVNGLDNVGAKIGDAIKTTKGTVGISKNTQSLIDDAINGTTADFSPITPLLKRVQSSLGNDLPVQDAFELKVILNNEIKKFVKSGDTGTQQYKALLKSTQELTDNIDTIVDKTKGLADLKKQYKELKAIANDITRSAQVEARSSPMSLVEQIGFLDAVGNPTGAVKQLFATQLKEMNSRGGNWKSLMDHYDKQAIKEFQKSTIKPKNITAPKPKK